MQAVRTLTSRSLEASTPAPVIPDMSSPRATNTLVLVRSLPAHTKIRTCVSLQVAED